MFNYSFIMYSIIASYQETVDGFVVIVGLPHRCGRDSAYYVYQFNRLYYTHISYSFHNRSHFIQQRAYQHLKESINCNDLKFRNLLRRIKFRIIYGHFTAKTNMPKMPRAKESLSLTQNQPQLLTQELCRSDPGSDDHFPISVSDTLVTLSSPLRSLSFSRSTPRDRGESSR